MTSLVAQSENHITNLGKRGNACDLPNDFLFQEKRRCAAKQAFGRVRKSVNIPIKTAAIGHVQWPSGARCLPMFCTALLIFLLCLPYTQPTVASADHSSTRVYTSIVDQQDLVDETSLVHHKLTEYWCRLSRHQLPELRLQLRSCCVWEGQVFRASPRRK